MHGICPIKNSIERFLIELDLRAQTLQPVLTYFYVQYQQVTTPVIHTEHENVNHIHVSYSSSFRFSKLMLLLEHS
jgi:hypothetical protein